MSRNPRNHPALRSALDRSGGRIGISAAIEKVHGHGVHLPLNVNYLTIPAQLTCRRIEVELLEHVDDRTHAWRLFVRDCDSMGDSLPVNGHEISTSSRRL
jgi:hypothetical protein